MQRESTVKWFDAKKGYGFIEHPDGGDDIFVHYSQIQSDDDFKSLRTGQLVSFELNDGPKGLHAVDVVAQPEPSDASPGEPPSSDPPPTPPDAAPGGPSRVDPPPNAPPPESPAGPPRPPNPDEDADVPPQR
jgi:CspA family cold shock protein